MIRSRTPRRRRVLTEAQKHAARERKAEHRREQRLIVGVDGEGEDRPCGECLGCDPADLDEPRTCKNKECGRTTARSYWPDRRCPYCKASGCLSPEHIYTYLAAVDENGVLVSDAYNPDGLSHNECCEMLLSLPKDSLCFGFMFSYDVTKIIEDLPPSERFYLMRPKLREQHICTDCGHAFSRWTRPCPDCGSNNLKKKMKPLHYGTRTYDYFNGSITIAEKTAPLGQDKCRRVKIWDCFRFFGCAFVSALEDWKVGTAEQVERISAMKQKRGAFDVEDPEAVKKYCQEECQLLAVMMRLVIEAHDAAGIPLKRFEGAGSTATALLKAHDVASYKGPRIHEYDPGLRQAVASAFFGGRFEDSMVGIVREPIHGFDISSAYPYALTNLPCLLCGQWKYRREITPEEIQKTALSVVHFRVKKISKSAREELAWGPLPCRDEKGSICYGTNFSGWAWGPEILSALAGWPDIVEILDAWVYERNCDHLPFRFMPLVYRERIKWGKEGAGKALKLGMNASYGKTAQSIGDDPPFQSWVWAGMATGVTRGILNGGICAAEDRWNVLTLATDGIYAKERLKIWHRRTFDAKKQEWSCDCTDCNTEELQAAPGDTGTYDLPKPLGGWEHKEIPEGVFVAKPGLYWRLTGPATTKEDEKKQLAELRARGIGRREAYTGKQKLEEGFLRWNRTDPTYHIPLVSRRFYGAKHSIMGYSYCSRCKRGWSGVPEMRCPKCHQTGTAFEARYVQDKAGKDAYGRWGARDVNIGFDPYPKREREGISKAGTYARLRVRDLEGIESFAYDVGAMDPVTTPEGMAARADKEFKLEQPDWEEGIHDMFVDGDPDVADFDVADFE